MVFPLKWPNQIRSQWKQLYLGVYHDFLEVRICSPSEAGGQNRLKRCNQTYKGLSIVAYMLKDTIKMHEVIQRHGVSTEMSQPTNISLDEALSQSSL